MNHFIRFGEFLLFLAVFGLVGGTVFAQTLPIRILPLGDSITDGSLFSSPAGTGGYRGPLYQLLTAAGYNVDYIGTQTVNSGQLVEKEHEGYSGWRIDNHDSQIASVLAGLAAPDVVLMHIGTNDFGQGNNVPTAIDRLDAFILKIATLRPHAHIIVTNLLERTGTPDTQIQTLFNPFVPARVAAHAAAGRRVTFLDLRVVVPLADMPDQLHPNQTGYNKMASAWFAAIHAVTGPEGDYRPPEIARVLASDDRLQVTITFNKPVADSAADPAKYRLSGGLSVLSAQLDASKRVVTLATSLQELMVGYTVTVSGVVDRTPAALALPPGTTAVLPRGYLHKVPESAGYTLVHTLHLPNTAGWGGTAVPYAVDNRAGLGPFTRIAYYLELQKPGGELQYVWASMDAFTPDANRIGVPTPASGAVFQQSVSGLNVVSNVAGVVNGSGMTGNLEFWPTNYSPDNQPEIPGASGSTFDFGDRRENHGTYGSMQLHNTGAAHTLFALNGWGNSSPGNNLDLGIGTRPPQGAGNPDWSFSQNANQYTVKSLQVLVQGAGDVTPPTLVAAHTSFSRRLVTVTFSEPVAANSVRAEHFALNGGLHVLGATLAPNQRDVQLLTTLRPVGMPLTVTVQGVRDQSPAANLIAPGGSLTVFAPALPPSVATNVAEAAGYQLVQTLNLPATGNRHSLVPAVDFTAEVTPFTRIAYYLELRTGTAAPQFVWTSMDAFTADPLRIGVPTPASGAVFKQHVDNLNVVSNVAGVLNGTGISSGNIEFWPTDYATQNVANVPGASEEHHDFGDNRSATGTYGSMQVHNHGAEQTLFAFNNWGHDIGSTTFCLGIGNHPAPVAGGVDWTFADNATSYSSRVLHVFVLPGDGDTAGPMLVSASGSVAMSRVVLTFDEPVADTAAQLANFAIAGLTIHSATLLPGQREIVLETSAQTSGVVYTVQVAGIRDRSAAGNLIASGASAQFPPNTPPTFSGFAFTTPKNIEVALPFASLVAKAFDANGHPLELAGVGAASAQGGSASLGASAVTYTPPVGFVGADSFTITIGDGQGGSVVGTVNVNVTALALPPAGQSALAFRTDGKLDTVFSGIPGQSYAVRRNTDLGNPLGWETIGTVTVGDDALLPFTDPNPPGDQAFYRIEPVAP